MTDDTIANVLGALALAIGDAIDDAIVDVADEPHTAAAALVHLSKYADASIDALRRPLGLSHPGCVRLVDRLEARRLVSRGAAPDRRARALRLTPAGRAMARAVLQGRQQALVRALDTLTPRERQTLGTLAGKILSALVHDETEALGVCRVCDYDRCPDDVCPVARALA